MRQYRKYSASRLRHSRPTIRHERQALWADRVVSAESRGGVLRQQREFRSNRPQERANNQRAIAAAACMVRVKRRPPALVPAPTATGVRRGSRGSTGMPSRKHEFDDRQIWTLVLLGPPLRCSGRRWQVQRGRCRERRFAHACWPILIPPEIRNWIACNGQPCGSRRHPQAAARALRRTHIRPGRELPPEQDREQATLQAACIG